ncbi:hypothetical protein AWRI3579_g565 [Hanseniaspora osmophila]|uniref:Uncharacterized protein n=1 Tax=Hanseniaspora osmophila TaxID=56408 RepID=A0A1E5RVI5_9ASCO|nr:hypothetical protein AWRI3579_g565 [Hanseniaspora osmophila]
MTLDTKRINLNSPSARDPKNSSFHAKSHVTGIASTQTKQAALDQLNVAPARQLPTGSEHHCIEHASNP